MNKTPIEQLLEAIKDDRKFKEVIKELTVTTQHIWSDVAGVITIRKIK